MCQQARYFLNDPIPSAGAIKAPPKQRHRKRYA